MAGEQTAQAQPATPPVQQRSGDDLSWLKKYRKVDGITDDSEIPAENEWLSKYKKVDPYSAGDKATVAAGAFTKSALKPVTMSGGALSGIAAGTPLGPPGQFAGGLIGAATGWYFAEAVEQMAEPEGYLISHDQIESLPEELRPYAYAGDVFGTGITFVGTPVGMSRTNAFSAGTSRVGKWVDGIIDTAGTRTKTYMAAEVPALASSAIASGVAEEVVPGQEGVRLASEVTAGILNPARLILSGSHKVGNGFRRVLSNWSGSAREDAASRYLVEVLEQYGEDPALVARILKENTIPGLDQAALTAAAKAGSPTLGAIERELIEHSADFGNRVKADTEEAIDSIRWLIAAAANTGDPSMVRQAAKMRREHFKTILNAYVTQAEKDALEAVGEISKDDPKQIAALSKKVSSLVTQSLKKARAVESELWKKIPKDIPIKPDVLLAKFDELKSHMLPEETLPEFIEPMMARIRQEIADGVPTSSEHMLRMKTRLFGLMQKARIAKDYDGARIYGQLHDAILDNLDVAFSKADIQDPAVALDLQAARDFSRELNDTFLRKFVGKTQAKNKYGEVMPPELMLERAFASGKQRADLQFRELEEATRFMLRPEFKEGGEEAINQMLDAQGRFLRLIAQNTVDAETGKVSTKALSTFIKNNGKLLERFPDVKNDLQAALKSEQARKIMERRIKGISMDIDRKATFAKLIKSDPVVIAYSAVTSPNVAKEVQSLAAVAKRGGQEAIDGLRVSLLDAAMRRATPSGGKLDLNQLAGILFDPPAAGKQSLIESMMKNGLMDKAQEKSLRDLFGQFVKIQIARNPDRAVEITEDIPGILSDFVTRIAGATVATKVAGATGGGFQGRGLIVAQRGSAAAREIFNKMPGKKIRDVLIRAMDDPKFAAYLLEKSPTKADEITIARQIHAYLFTTGVIGIRDAFEEESQQDYSNESP